jgi:hypothetical protein
MATGNYFSKFPEIRYGNVLIRDTTRRVNFLRNINSNPYVFLPYTIKEGERAEDIAYHYYRDANYDWLVYLSNNIIDPYSEWPMDDYTFDQYIISKYEIQSGGEKGWDIVLWSQDETRNDNVLYYYKETDFGIIKTTKEGATSSELDSEWKAYRIYEYEKALNENKRNIVLLDRLYLAEIEKEMRDKLK